MTPENKTKEIITKTITIITLTMPTLAFPVYSFGKCEKNKKPKNYSEFKSCTYKEPKTNAWIVDGDIPIYSEKELKAFYASIVYANKENKYENLKAPFLIVNKFNNADDLWGKDKQCNIRYCISKKSTGANYEKAKKTMLDAGAAWSSIAGVRFVHVESMDTTCDENTQNVDFDVQAVAPSVNMARAFFPSNIRARRNILIDARAFDPLPAPTTLVGVLRHELGHAIGFRHEHTRPEAANCFEDNSWRPLTPYDSESVMHYPQCGGTATKFLEISTRDITGAVSAYGKPNICQGNK